MPESYRVEKWTGEKELSASELKQVMESEGFSVFQWSDPPGAYYSPHVHPDEQSHWIVSGTIELDVPASARSGSDPAIATLCRPKPSTPRP